MVSGKAVAPSALIIGDSTGALAAARDLGQAGWTVGVMSRSRLGWASRSRWTARWHCLPVNPLDDESRFVAAINAACANEKYDVVFAAGDAAVLTLSKHREQLQPVVPYGPHGQVVRAFDKLEMLRFAAASRIAGPCTVVADDDNIDAVGFPCIVKPRLHWTSVQVAACNARDAGEAGSAIRRIRKAGGEALIQEHLPGGMLVFVALMGPDRRLVASYAQTVTHFGPSESGTFARARTLPSDHTLVKNVQAFLAQLEWFGLVNLQFLIRSDGEPALIDFNGRMFGSLIMAHACGLSLMDAWGRLTLGEDVPEIQSITGARYHSMEADLSRILAQSPGSWVRELPDLLARAISDVHPILCHRDPGPTLAYWQRLIARATAHASPGN